MPKDNNHNLKSDILILIVGTSPMPNLIGACTRIKENGQIFLIYTRETEKIAKKLKNLIDAKSKAEKKDICININGMQLDISDNPEKISRQMKRILEKIFSEYDNSNKDIDSGVIELIYNGGTKVMSTQAYSIFKNKYDGKNALLTYLDGEKSQINILNLRSKKENIIPYSKTNETLSITIDDIISLHAEKGSFEEDTYSKKHENKFSMEIYNQLLKNNQNKDEDILKMVEELNSLPTRDFNFSDNYKLHGKEFVDYVDKILINSPIKFGKYSSFKSIIDDYEKDYADCSKSMLFEHIKCDLRGIWLEKAILKLLENLKVDDVKHSVKGKEDNDDTLFEVDLLVLNNHKLFCISVTTATSNDLKRLKRKQKEYKFKLYEIRLRTEILTGSEGSSIFINLFNNTEYLKNEYKDTWDKELNSTLIIGNDKIKNLEYELKNWIIGGDISGS